MTAEAGPTSDVTQCRACPRLVGWREQVAFDKRAAFRTEEYWGKPVPSFGDPGAALLIVGLAPAAHGANRTGRMFTGDRSGEWLYRALFRNGLANQPGSHNRCDALTLTGCRITAVIRCAPPDNRPTREELVRCSHWLVPELERSAVKVLLALGGIAFDQVLRLAPQIGWAFARPRPRFAHGAEVVLSGGPVLLGSYHPSQQNTFTGRLTEEMLDGVVARARTLCGG